MKNVKEFSKEIKKDLKEPNRNSTETITIRVTTDEKNSAEEIPTQSSLTVTAG